MPSTRELRQLRGTRKRMLLYLNDPSARVLEIGPKLYLKRQSGAMIGVLRSDVLALQQLGLIHQSGPNEFALSEEGKRTIVALEHPEHQEGA